VDEVSTAIPGGVAAGNDKHQLPALELPLNLAEDTALNLHKKYYVSRPDPVPVVNQILDVEILTLK